MPATVNPLSETVEVATVLYVKNFPEALRRRIHSTAVERGESMRDLVIRAVKAELERLGVEVPEDEDG
jgi:hypothetical protein